MHLCLAALILSQRAADRASNGALTARMGVVRGPDAAEGWACASAGKGRAAQLLRSRSLQRRLSRTVGRDRRGRCSRLEGGGLPLRACRL